MSEQKPTRLAKAATYFNVGREEILDFLISKGFSIDNNPNAKIDDSMFIELSNKFENKQISIIHFFNKKINEITIVEIITFFKFYGIELTEITNQKSVIRTSNSIIGIDDKLVQLNIEGKITNGILESIKLFKDLNTLSINKCEIEDVDFLNSLVNLKVLDLSDNKIQNINSIANLINLETLILTKNYIKDISSIKNLKNLSVLELSQNSIINLIDLQHLNKIHYLNLSYNPNLVDVFEINQLYKITYLNISNCNINTIESFTSLKELSHLDISNNKIQSIEELIECDALIDLKFENNPVYEKIPFSIIQSRDLKKILKYKSPEILDLERSLGILIFQRNYNVTNGKIDEFYFNNLNIEEWTYNKQFIYVEYLNISYCNFKSLSFIVKCFPYIKRIDAEFNKIEDLTEFNKLKKLECLNLSNNEIKQIDFKESMPYLKNLFLNNNKIEIFESLENIKSVELLEVRSNQLKNINGFDKLINLKQLDISDNKIETIQPIIDLDKLEEVNLYNNTNIEELKLVSAEEINLGWKTIVKSIKSDDKVSFNEVKILLLGNPNIGKSDLLEFLDPNKKPTEKESTHGIQYRNFKLEDINCHIWDFGGQEYYHATHQLFFSANALNIVLWGKDIPRDENRPEKCFELEYWLRSVQHLNNIDKIDNNQSECIVLENKIDLQGFLPTHLNFEKLSNQFNHLNLYFQNISLQELRRVNGLKELIIEILNKIVKDNPRPKSYKIFIDNVKSNNRNFIKIEEVANSGTKEEKIEGMSLLHNMGMVLYFKDIFPDKVFNQPQLLLDLLYDSILTKEKKDRISKEEIEEKIKDNSLEMTCEEVIKLLLNFKLIFQINTNDYYFIPQYLPSKPDWLEILEKYKFAYPNIRIQSDNYIVNLVLLSLFAEYGKIIKNDSNNYLFWNEGLLIEKENQILLIKVDKSKQSIELYTDYSISNFELQFEVIEFIKTIPLNEDEFPAQSIYIYELIDGKKDWVSDYFSFEISNDGVNYAKWEDANSAKSNRFKSNEFWFNTRDFKKYINSNNRLKTIAISYSKDDLEIVNSYINSLKPLVLDGLIDEPWYCTYLSTGEVVNEKIKDKFENADILCFMYSNNFFKTSYIIDYELKPAILRKNNGGNQVILPIIIDRCKWIFENKEIRLNDYTAFPYRGKPVSDFFNWNDAWFVTNWFLEKMIINNLYNNSWEKWDEELKKNDSQEVNDLLIRQIKGKLDKK